MKYSFLLLIVFLQFHGAAWAQSSPVNSGTSEDAQGETPIPKDKLGRDTPQGTMKGALDAFARDDFAQAIQYFDFQNLPKKNREEKSRQLTAAFFQLLDQGGQLIPTGVLSDQAEGGLKDDLATNLEAVGRITWEGQTIPVMLERQTDKTQNLDIWLISAETIKRLQKLPVAKKGTPENAIDSVLPESLLTNKWRGAPLGHWLGMVVLLIASYAVSWLFTSILGVLIRTLWRGYSPQKHAKLIQSFLVPVSLVATVIIFLTASRASGFSIIVRESFAIVNISLLWAALFLFLWLLIDTFASRSEQRMRKKKNFGGLSIILFFRLSIKFILLAVAGILILDTLGVNVGAGLAALGIGGIALALGAQKTIENLVGSLSVVFDQPVRVGDFCRVGDTLGTIEAIGMRSTRIRTLERTVTTIPNGDFSTQLIDNYTHRDKFLFKTTLGLRYETSSDQMRYILTELRAMLYSHPKVETTANPTAARVRFLGYGPDSLQIQLYAYILVATFDDFLAVQEDLNLRIGGIIEESGSGFAFPSQTLYLAKDTGLSVEKTKQAEDAIQKQIKDNKLKFPDFSSQDKENLENTADYPPKGSASNASNNNSNN